MPEALNLPSPCVVVLVGPGASGKSTWAAAHFPPDTVVSSDRLRALVGAGERRRRGQHRRVRAAGGGRPAPAGPPADHRDRHARPGRDAPAGVAGAGPRARPAVRGGRLRHPGRGVPGAQPAPGQADPGRRAHRPAAGVGGDPRAAAHRGVRHRAGPAAGPGGAGGVRGGGPGRAAAGGQPDRAAVRPAPRRVRLPAATTAGRLRGDRVRRRVGRLRRDLRHGPLPADPAGRPGLGRLPGELHHARLPGRAAPSGSGSGRWSPASRTATSAHLGKIVATLDVLSGGRAVCGLGLAWFKQEHLAYGWPFPPTAERYALLEDALQLLPMLWGPGSPAFAGQVLTLPETTCYPRPLQEHVPIIVGRRRRAAHPAAGRAVRRRRQRARRPGDGPPQGGGAARALRASVGPRGRAHPPVHGAGRRRRRHADRAGRAAATAAADPARYAAAVNAGTVDDHIGRFRELAEAGVREVMVRLPDLTDAAPLERAASVISAFR